MSETITAPGKRVKHDFTIEEVENALQSLFLLNGSPAAASRATGIDESTIRYWRDKTHAERWQQITTEGFPELHARITAMHEANAAKALEKVNEALDQLDPTALKQPELAKAIMQLSTTSGIHTDKSWNGRDKPASITEQRTAIEILDSLQRRIPAGVIDSDAEEIQDAEEVPGLPASS